MERQLEFQYSSEQQALKAEARRFLSEQAPLSKARAVLDRGDGGYDAELWAQLGDLGWCGAALPEAYGGHGMGYVELCALAEELGRSLAPVPFASTIYQFAEALLVAGSEEQKASLAPQIAEGRVTGVLALSEQAGPLASGETRTAVRGGAIFGRKAPVVDGMTADYAAVLAKDEAGREGLYLVDLRGPGVAREHVSTLDPSRGAAILRFDGAAQTPLGQGAAARSVLPRILDRAAVLLAFEQLGGAERCLEMARDYALQRYTFGRPIGSYQAIKHKLADVYVKNAVARANCLYAAWALSTDAPELAVAAAAARIAASEAYALASKENIQTHGGIGFTWEADCHLFFRRARHLSLLIGAPREWKRKLVAELEAMEPEAAPRREADNDA